MHQATTLLLLHICSKQEKDGLVQNSNTFLRVTSSSQHVPRGRWRGVYLRVRRNEVTMPRFPSSGNTVQVQTHTNAHTHGNIRTQVSTFEGQVI